jgi:succinoglycan biosynthesis protein ExoA
MTFSQTQRDEDMRGKRETWPEDEPVVSVVMPVKNEGGYMQRALESLIAQTYPSSKIEILVVDGGSTDETCGIVRKLAEKDSRIRLFTGENANCPAAMNIGIRHSTGQIVAKIDGHGYIEPEFIALAVRCLSSDESIACVGGRIVPLASTSVQKANSYARFSTFGVGKGPYSAPESSRFVDTVQCGVYKKPDLLSVGSFDPLLQFGEDEEVNWRVIKSGKKILFHPDLRFHYHVRPTFKGIFKQYFNYGKARVQVVRKHPDFLKLKHCLPSVLTITLFLSILATLTLFRAVSPAISSAPLVAYVAYLIVAGTAIGIREKYFNFFYLCFSLASIHIGYGLGFINGLMKSVGGRTQQYDGQTLLS